MHLDQTAICQQLRQEFEDNWRDIRNRAYRCSNTPENAVWLKEMITFSRTMMNQMPPTSLTPTARRTHIGVTRFPRVTKKQRKETWQKTRIVPDQKLPTIEPLEFLLKSDANNCAWPIFLAKKGDAIDGFLENIPENEQIEIRRNIAKATHYWQCKTCFRFDAGMYI